MMSSIYSVNLATSRKRTKTAPFDMSTFNSVRSPVGTEKNLA